MTGITVTVTVPKGKLLDLERIVKDALVKEAKADEEELMFPAKTWQTQVDFETTFKSNAGGQSVEISTDNRIYVFNDVGTKAHKISAVRARTLRYFKTGFKAKTSVGRLKSGAGRRATVDEVFPLDVQHPGTKARGFSKIVAKNTGKRLARRITKGIRNGLR